MSDSDDIKLTQELIHDNKNCSIWLAEFICLKSTLILLLNIQKSSY